MQYLYAYYLHEKAGSTALLRPSRTPRQQFEREVDQIKKSLAAILQLLSSWSQISQSEKKAARPTHALLAKNSLLRALQNAPDHEVFTKPYGQLWERETLVLRYHEGRTAIDALARSIVQEEKKPTQERTFVRRLLQEIVLAAPAISQEVNERSMTGEADSHLLENLAFSFFKKLTPGTPSAFQFFSQPAPLAESTLYVELISGVLREHDTHTTWLRKQVPHWDIERLFLLDTILLSMGLIELFHFPETPNSVVIYEYLEIAKRYSTPKSPAFIHGLLDSLLKNKTLGVTL